MEISLDEQFYKEQAIKPTSNNNQAVKYESNKMETESICEEFVKLALSS